MTRSIGDYIAHSIGVISEPVTKEYILNADDQAIVIASDGVWEYMSNAQVAEIATQHY